LVGFAGWEGDQKLDLEISEEKRFAMMVPDEADSGYYSWKNEDMGVVEGARLQVMGRAVVKEVAANRGVGRDAVIIRAMKLAELGAGERKSDPIHNRLAELE